MADNELNVRIKASAEGVKEAADLAKEQLERATQSASLLSKTIGIEVPEALQKVMAQSELLGPALAAAFEPLAVISFAGLVVDATEKISQFIADTFIFTDEEKRAAAALSETNKQLAAMADETRKVDRERRLLAASTNSARTALQEQFELEDIGGDPEKLRNELTRLGREFEQINPAFMTYSQTVVAGKENIQRFIDAANQLSAHFKTDDEKVWAAKMEDLQNKILHYTAALQLATAVHGRFQAQRNKELHQEGEAAFRASLDRELADLKQNHLVSTEEELQFWRARVERARAYPQTLQEINQRIGDLNQQFLRKQSAEYMAGWMRDIQQQVAATKAGSKERVDAYDRAIDEMSATDAINSKEFQQLLDRRAAAFREYVQKQQQDAKTLQDLQTKINSEIAKEDQLRRDIADTQAKHTAQLQVALGYKTQEQAAEAAIRQLEKDKAEALNKINSELAAQEAIIKRLALETKDGSVGTPEQLAAYKQAVLAYERMKVQQLEIEKKYDSQIEGEQLKLTNTFTAQLRKQMLAWQQVHQQMGQLFLQTLNSMNQNLASFITTGQANWKQLASSVIEEIIKIGLQWIESHTIMALLNALFKQKEADQRIEQMTTNVTANFVEAQSAAGLTGANTMATMSLINPLIAPAVAAANYLVAQGFADIAGFAAGGIVPMDGFAKLHRGEVVLPASMSGRGDFDKIGGNHFHVTFAPTIQALDADGVDAVLTKHRSRFVREFEIIAKKKGFGR